MGNAGQDLLCLHREHWEQMLREVKVCFPEEACGLVAAKDGCSIAVFPVENILHHPARFRMEPHQQVGGILEIEARNWELFAIFHSHPSGPPYPSETDLAEAAYPGVAYLIWSIRQGEWICQGYMLQDGRFMQLHIHLLG